MRRNAQAAVTDLQQLQEFYGGAGNARRTFGPARGAKMEILAAGWLDLAGSAFRPCPGANYVCYTMWCLSRYVYLAGYAAAAAAAENRGTP